MSRQRDDRDFDPLAPSTSSGYRKSQKPYKRPSNLKEEYLPRGVIKSSNREIPRDTSASTSSSQRQHGITEPEEIKLGEGACGAVASTKEIHGRRKETIFVTRPSTLVTKKGASGRHVTLQTNYFKLPTVPSWCIYKYRVDFTPEENRTFVRKGMLKLHREKFGPHIFDGTVLYSPTCLPEKMDFVSTRQSDGVNIKITIRSVGDMLRNDPEYIMIFNIIMRKCLEYLQLQLVGRDYYDTRNKLNIYQFKLELWPGYITSIRQYEQNVLMCVEITHKVLCQETLLHMLNDCYKSSRDYRKEFCNRVIGTVVLTDYNNHTYRVEDVDFDVSPSSTFSMKSGESISYQEYYKKKYKIVLTNSTQPMLVSRVKPKERNAGKGDLVYLVPELCRATGLTDKMKEHFPLMRELATHTRVSPESRIDKLMRFNSKLRQEPKVIKELKDWEMKLDRNLVDVQGRILAPEKLRFGGDILINCGLGDWSRDIQKAPLLRCKELRNWVVIGNQRAKRNIETFIETLRRVSRELSFRIEYPQVHWLYEDNPSAYAETLEYILSKGTPDLMFCVVSNNRSDRYSSIKKKCCIDRPVPSQVFLQKNLEGRNTMSIATKVAIQMNCKLGGAPWCIETPIRGLMAIGFDICRDSSTKGRDFLAMVATIDQTLTRYFSSISVYQSSEELGEQVCANICKAVQAYRSLNKALPMYLIIYRDAVSDGQIPQICEHEVENLKKKLEKVYYGPNFKMMFIIVSKKINTRFFFNKRNPQVGTVVDDVVTSPFKYDFFIVSQQIRQGTTAPTSYNVISDNTGLNPDTVQSVTYKLTHMYFNCSSTVRVPAPCHYALKLSTLVGRFLHQPPDTRLENQLFYL